MVLKAEATNNDYNETTTIKITVHVWKRLSALKSPGDSFNSVIQRLLEKEDTA